MTTKSTATGREIREFYEENWPEGYYHEDSVVEFYDGNGSKADWVLEPDQKYNLNDMGVLVPENHHDDKGLLSFKSAYTKWANSREFETLTLRIKKTDREALLALIARSGLTVTVV